MDKRLLSSKHCSVHWEYTNFPHGGYILPWLCLGKKIPGKGSSQCKGPEVIGVGNVRALSRLAGVLWLVDKGRQQEGGGAVRGLWGDRAGGADATGCPCLCCLSAPPCDACQWLLTCCVPSEVFSGHMSKSGVQQGSPGEPESRLTQLHLAESPRAQKVLSPRQMRMGVTLWS